MTNIADRRIHWRCFHCGETFTKAQKRWAGEHFGRSECDTPVCMMRVPGEASLLTALRNAQSELESYRAEDSDLMRALYAMQADHAVALRREEERGYEKGMRDAKLVAPELSAEDVAKFQRAFEDLKTGNITLKVLP